MQVYERPTMINIKTEVKEETFVDDSGYENASFGMSRPRPYKSDTGEYFDTKSNIDSIPKLEDEESLSLKDMFRLLMKQNNKLSSEVTNLDSKMESGIKSLGSEVSSLDLKINARIKDMGANFNNQISELEIQDTAIQNELGKVVSLVGSLNNTAGRSGRGD